MNGTVNNKINKHVAFGLNVTRNFVSYDDSTEHRTLRRLYMRIALLHLISKYAKIQSYK